MIDPNKFLFNSRFGYGRVTKEGSFRIVPQSSVSGKVLATGLQPWTRWDVRIEINGKVYAGDRFNFYSAYNDKGTLKVDRSAINETWDIYWVVYGD